MPSAIVVGGGPAGLIGAEVLAKAGFEVTVYEHMASAGRKLILAGRGGLNLTHSEPAEAFAQRYGPARANLAPALQAFSPTDLRDWCAGLGEPTFVGSSGRVFPESFKATPLLRAWLRRLERFGVRFQPRHKWSGFVSSKAGCSRFVRRDGTAVDVSADVTVMALGGASWPRVGSDGTWVDDFVRLGVEVTRLQPSNCGVVVAWSGDFVERFAGVPLKNVAISVGDVRVRGDAMVTELGLEGGPVYAHSAAIRTFLEHNAVGDVLIDLHPDMSVSGLAERLAKRRRPKDSRSTWLRRCGLDQVSVALMRQAVGAAIPLDALDLAGLVKAVPVQVESLMPIDRAISTAGGVAFSALDESFMVRRLPGVFLAGEMLDWEAPTGGYLLQASFSTGVAAARGAVSWFEASGAASST